MVWLEKLTALKNCFLKTFPTHIREHGQSLSHVCLFVTHGLKPSGLFCLWNFSGKNTIVGCHFLLQGIFPAQESNPSLLASALTGRLVTTAPLGKSHIREGISLLDFTGGTVVKNLPADAGDARDVNLILNWGRSPDGANDKPLQFSCLENSMDKEPGELQSMELQRVRHNEAHTHESTLFILLK